MEAYKMKVEFNRLFNKLKKAEREKKTEYIELKKEEEEKIAEIKAKIKDTGDLVAFMYDHCVACAEEYTDWTARRAVKELAKEMLGLEL